MAGSQELSDMAVMRPDPASAEPSGWETIEELFAALESPLLGYAARLAGGPDQAEDIVQDAFMKLHAQFDEVREPRKWLYRTVHNLALNHRRASVKIVPLEAAGSTGKHEAIGETADPEPLPDEQIVRLEGIGLVRLSLETLDSRSRELIRLKFSEGLSYKEISARTGLRYILHHALKAIAEELAKNGVVP
jgi:RNA polymerase sigma factor (sigma-70 family)